MTQTHLMLLPDIVLLEIFSYLSCEDVLYTFGSFQDFDLLHEMPNSNSNINEHRSDDNHFENK